MALKVSSAHIPKFNKTKIYTKSKCQQDKNNFKDGKKIRPLKCSGIFRNLIAAFSISLFILQLKSSDPYKDY